MIEDIYGHYGRKMVTCDNCMDGFESESYRDAQERMSEDGWVTKRINGEWKHYHAECAEAMK